MIAALYDEEVGTPKQAVVEEVLSIEVAKELEDARQIELMCATGGWQLVQSWIAGMIDNCKEKLVDANDPEEIRKLQQSARAYSNVLGWVLHQKDLVSSTRSNSASDNQR